ncbi:MAG: YceI family protein [Planctomycetes bacterium]|nr:YceI family protein [Planctomycetota bacterium]MCB9904398.1 YceI family protein [Planctomycetota bacterium]
MMKQGLRFLGAFSLLAWTGLGLVAWTQVGERVTFVVSDGSDARDESERLVADRVETLSTDLDELVAALESNLGRIAEAMAEESNAQAAESARVHERLVALEAALPSALQARETAGALSATLARLEALAATSGPLDQPPALPIASLVEETPPVAESEPPIAVEAAPAEPVVERKRSFLAFDLPSRDFRFEGVQRFEVLDDLSRVGFDAKSTLHDFTGISDHVRGEFTVDLAHPENGISGAITVRVDTLNTGVDGRDEALREHMDNEHFEELTFEPTRFDAARSDASQLQLDGIVHGKLTIHGVTREVEVAVQTHVDESRRLVLEGEWPLLLSDYEIPVPNQLGVVSMQDEVRAWLRLRTRARAESVAR